eukprot:symbB.v1.2.024974.t2/scaffold2401.1/size80084/6
MACLPECFSWLEQLFVPRTTQESEASSDSYWRSQGRIEPEALADEVWQLEDWTDPGRSSKLLRRCSTVSTSLGGTEYIALSGDEESEEEVAPDEVWDVDWTRACRISQ